ncbi:MAG TPA: chemotaxis protein CheB [Gemmatimonadaceae bacterium]|jgi:two-component system chemotaxis response regulator CheB
MSGWIPRKRSTGRSGESESPDVAYRIVVVGTSWGGLAALRMLVEALPPEYDIPTVIVQHRHRDADAMLARFLQDFTQLRVCEVEDKQPIEARRLFIAPANYHMLVEQGHFSLSTEAPVRFSRPSIDVAMTSAAVAYGHRAVGVVLTGANADGADGLRRIASGGGMAVIQDPATAEVKTMPVAALKAVPTARVFPLERIAPFLGTLPSSRERTHRTA